MKKFLSLFLVLLLALAVLAGCAQSEDPAADDGKSSSPAAGDDTVNDAEGTTIQVYALTSLVTETVDQIVADYKEETGVTLEWEIPGDEPYTVIKARFASGEGPDIFNIATGDFPDWGVRCADLSDEAWMTHVEDLAMAPMTVDGKQLGFPLFIEGNGYLYNKDLFDQAGITEIPDTLDKLEATAQQLEAAGIQAFGEAWKNWGFLMHIFGTPFAYEQDLAAMSEQLASGEKEIKDLTYIDNFFRLYDMTLDYGFGPESVGYDVMTQITDFATGQIAMIKQGTWMATAIMAANPELNMGMFAVPMTNDPANTKLMVSTTQYLCINKDSENVAACKAFLDWFSTHLDKYVVTGMQIATPYDNVESAGLGSLYDDMDSYVKADKTFPVYGIEYWPTGFNTDLATPLQAYAAGTIDKEQCLEQLQEAYNNRLIATGN